MLIRSVSVSDKSSYKMFHILNVYAIGSIKIYAERCILMKKLSSFVTFFG